MNKIIKGAQGKRVDQVIYNSKGNLISCSCDGFIKIWELKNGEYKNIVTFNHLKRLTLFYYLKIEIFYFLLVMECLNHGI